MRRKDKQISDRAQLDRIIHGSEVCRLALSKDNCPYLVPMSFGYDGEAIYLHSAQTGKKISYIEANNRVCFEFERNVSLKSHETDACRWSFEFESVIGYGSIHEVFEPDKKEYGLRQIMEHYSAEGCNFTEDILASVRVWRIAIASLTGKASGR